MKKIIPFILLLCLIASPAYSDFLYQVQILSKEEVSKLNEEQLVDLYTDAMIERQASETFHGRAGFAPKEYEAYKKLLGLIVNIRKEMTKREIEAPPIDEWLK